MTGGSDLVKVSAGCPVEGPAMSCAFNPTGGSSKLVKSITVRETLLLSSGAWAIGGDWMRLFVLSVRAYRL